MNTNINEFTATMNPSRQRNVSSQRNNKRSFGMRSFVIQAALMTLTAFAVPTHAAVIDEVKSKVNSIKNDTNTLKNKTSTIVAKTTKQLQETAKIKGALEPLFALKTRFEEMGIAPAELLDMLPADEVQGLIADFQHEAQEARERLTDPDLETFRQEFIEILRGISEVISDHDVVEVSPLETLVELAPPAVLAVVKAATEAGFLDLQREVSSVVERANVLRDIGVFDLLRPEINPHQGNPMVIPDERKATLATVACRTVDGDVPVVWIVAEYRLILAGVKNLVAKSVMKIESKKKRFALGIHGYFDLNLTAGKHSYDAANLFLKNLEMHIDQMGIIAGLVKDVPVQVNTCPST